jgi:hypothetical protein
MQKYKNFFDYLFETVELNPVISKDENIHDALVPVAKQIIEGIK